MVLQQKAYGFGRQVNLPYEEAVLGIVGNPKLNAIARDVKARMRRVVERVAGRM